MPAERVAMRQAREDHQAEVFGFRADARDRAAPWRRAFDRAGDIEARRERGARLAFAGRHERRRVGGGALRQSPSANAAIAACLSRIGRPSIAS